MDFHIERKLAVNSNPEHKNLYGWAIVETDERGQRLGIDQIPWEWTLFFKATEFSYSDTFRIETMDMMGREKSPAELTSRAVIRAKLVPGHPRDDDGWNSEPTYRMFGTDRVIRDFRLDVLPAKLEDPESCTVWGSVSYTSEVDFRTETTDDIINFYLLVRQERFDRYVWNIANGVADELVLSVGRVDGFYSEWSPSVSTRDIKVLTAGQEQSVDSNEGIEIPRLGKVGQVEFSMNARRVVNPPVPVTKQDEEESERSGFRWPGRR